MGRERALIAIAYVVILIAAAAALVGADELKGGLGHVKQRNGYRFR
jgi:hypothetical protein